MLRKPLAVAAAVAALATPSTAFANHGPGEQAPRMPRNLESHGSLAAGLLTGSRSPSFSWLDAGIGASFACGCVLVLAAGYLVIVRRQRRVALFTPPGEGLLP
jgi:hypothetical protein